MLTTTFIITPLRRDPPASFREGHDGSLACPHRDCSCCDECADEHREIVDVVGAHFWVATQEERDELARMMAEPRDETCPACGLSLDADAKPREDCDHDEGCGWLRREQAKAHASEAK